MHGVYKRTQITLERLKNPEALVVPASSISQRKEQKFITISFLVESELIIQPEVTWNDEVDYFNILLFSNLMQDKLADLNNRESDIWADYEIGNDFLCDYLDCQSASIGLYFVRPEKVEQFEQVYAKNKRVSLQQG
jgi:hypothetical protein